MTKSVAKAKVAIAKVKQAANPPTGIGGGEEIRPPDALEGAPTPSETYLPRVNTCLRFLEDSIPQEVKKKALKRNAREGLQRFIQLTTLISLLPEGLDTSPSLRI